MVEGGRRQLLKGVSLGLLGLSIPKSADANVQGACPSYAMIIDLERCMGCEACVVSCKIDQNTPQGAFNIRIKSITIGIFPQVRPIFVPVQCNHCDNPPCLSACSKGAIKKLNSGIVITDWRLCDGKGQCIKACPIGARHLDERFGNRSFKCDLCIERLEKGLKPVCVETCPSGARIFGDLNNPKGEFREYISKKHLYQYGPRFGHGGRIFYAGIENLESIIPAVENRDEKRDFS